MIKSLLSLFLLHASAAAAVSLTAARDTYELNKVAEAEQLYQQIIADPQATSDDRAGAGVELARIAWLIDGNSHVALQRLDAAKATGGKPCKVAAMTARVLHEAHDNLDALRREPQLIGACNEPDGLDEIRTHLIGARLDLVASGARGSKELLAAAKAEGGRLGPASGLEGSRARLEAALLSGDAAAALAAWKDYYWLDDSDAPQALASWPVTQTFNDGLKSNASVEERLKLADLLMHAGFHQASQRYAAAYDLSRTGNANPIWRRLQAYWQVRASLEATILRVNRGLARGKRDDKSIEAAVKQSLPVLMMASGATGDPRSVLLKNYGLVGTDPGSTGGYPSIHLGHVVEDRHDRVTQYGHSAEIHFQSIDNMISNGFQSWLWDGSAGVGGWTSNGVIVQVRPRYVRGPLLAKALRDDGPARRELIAHQPAKAAEDIAKLKARPVATMEGLNDRLQLQVVDRVAAAARAKAGTTGDVDRAFLAEFVRASFQQSIFIHEGRHAIDEVLKVPRDGPLLEYRAKLSELGLADYPRMALNNMNRNVEGDSQHDKAVARLFGEFGQWMQTHSDQIMSYDPNVPVLEQMDKLTDSQIREIAHGLDPLAVGSSSATTAARSAH